MEHGGLAEARCTASVENPDEYKRILGLATDEGRRLAEKDPDGFDAFVLADSRNRGRGTVPTALDNGQRSPPKLRRAVVARLLGPKL